MPPARRFGAPPAYAARVVDSRGLFTHGQPLHSGSWRPFVAILVLLPLLIAPMVLTCLTWLKTYDEQRVILRAEVSLHIWRGLVVRVLEVVAAVVSIPLVSSILAQAAVACTQRSRPQQSLSLEQLVALSDRKWLDLTLPFTYFSPFSVGALVLIILTFINIPLRAILIPHEPRLALLCDEIYSRGGRWTPRCGGHIVLGTEPVPRESLSIGRDGLPAGIDPIVQTIVDGLETITYLNEAEKSSYYDASLWLDTPVWESSVPSQTNTGFVRQHALRYNSSAHCESIPPEDFPSVCDEDTPAAFFVRVLTDDLRLRICVPPNGWKRFEPHRDAQEITEYMYLSAQAWPRAAGNYLAPYSVQDLGNATVRCTAATTRGYFELPNDHNDGKPSDIRQKWPSEETMDTHFSDYTPGYYFDSRPMTREIAGASDEYAQAGPMMRVAQAFFGPKSYFARAIKLYEMSKATAPHDVLNYQTMPLSNLWFVREGRMERGMSFEEPSFWQYDASGMPRQLFAKPSVGSRAISAAVHVANQAFFIKSASEELSFRETSPREIVRYAGETISTPRASLAAITIAVVLLAIQVILIVILWFYVNFKPTWTESLDALAMMKLGAHLQGRLEFPELGKTKSVQDKKFLREADGLIGMVAGAAPMPGADVELANMAPRVGGTTTAAAAARSATPEEWTRGPGEGEPAGVPPRVPHVSVEDTDGDIASAGHQPHHRRISLSSLGPPSSPPPSYYGSEITNDERVMKGPYTLAVGGTGLLNRSLWLRHRQYRGGR